MLWLTEKGAIDTPKSDPQQLHNEGNYVVGLGNVVRWLGQQAEALGVESSPVFRPPKCSTTTTAR